MGTSSPRRAFPKVDMLRTSGSGSRPVVHGGEFSVFIQPMPTEAMYESHIRRASQNVFFADSAWLLMPCSGDGSTVAEPLPLQNQPLAIVAVASNGEKPL